jgi:hypothetical protein
VASSVNHSANSKHVYSINHYKQLAISESSVNFIHHAHHNHDHQDHFLINTFMSNELHFSRYFRIWHFVLVQHLCFALLNRKTFAQRAFPGKISSGLLLSQDWGFIGYVHTVYFSSTIYHALWWRLCIFPRWCMCRDLDTNVYFGPDVHWSNVQSWSHQKVKSGKECTIHKTNTTYHSLCVINYTLQMTYLSNHP